MRYFPPYSHSKKNRNRINNVTKSDLKNSAGVDTSQFAEKDDYSNLKADVDKLYVDY